MGITLANRRHSRYDDTPGCSIEAALSLIDGKWKGVILHMLLDRSARFSELARRAESVSARTLTNQLRELEADGLIHREVFAEVPPRVVYSISPLGRTLEPVLSALRAWGDAHAELFGRDSGPPPSSG